jgi:nucleotide-binding universal stress UspA family protein
MYERMLVPLDRSELAEVVIPYAKELAGRLDLDVTLLHVAPPEEEDSLAMHRQYLEQVAETLHGQSHDVQRKTGTGGAAKEIHVHAELAVGHAAEEILKHSVENRADLILMATHGRSGIRRWVLGSVADKTLRASTVPVWLVRAGIREEIIHEEWLKRTMVVPLDGSQLGESVLPHVEALARQRGTGPVNVILLAVCERPFITADYPEASMSLTWDEHVKYVNEHFRHVCERSLAGPQERLEKAGINVRSEVLLGSAAHEIIEFDRKRHPTLIVMATHGRSGVSRWAYGSVADKVLHGSESPILLIRPH